MEVKKKEQVIVQTDPAKVREILKQETAFFTRRFTAMLEGVSDDTIKKRFAIMHEEVHKAGKAQIKSEPDSSLPVALTTYREIPRDGVHSVHDFQSLACVSLAYFRDHAQKKIELMFFELAAEALWFAPYNLEKKRGTSEEQASKHLRPIEDFEYLILQESVKRLKGLWAQPADSQSPAFILNAANKLCQGLLLHTYDNDEVKAILREGLEHSYKNKKRNKAAAEIEADYAAEIISVELKRFVEMMLNSLILSALALAWQSMLHTLSSPEEEKYLPEKPSKTNLKAAGHRAFDYWLSTYDDFLKGVGRPAKPRGNNKEELKRLRLEAKRQALREGVMNALRDKGFDASAAQIAQRLQIGGKGTDIKPQSRARTLRRQLAAVGLSFEDLKWQAKLSLETRTS